MQGIGFRFSHAVLVAFTLLFLLLASTPGRAGEGGEKTSSSPTKAKVSKPCFTLLNPAKIPADATPLARLNAARVDVHWNPKDGTTLRQVFTDFGRTIGVPVIFMPEAKKIISNWKTDRRRDHAVYPIDGKVQDIPARGYLDYLLYTVNEVGVENLRWDIHEGKIFVSELGELPWGVLERRIYKVGQLLGESRDGGLTSEGDSDGRPVFGEEDILELITSAIFPESWQELGGSGTITTGEFANVLAVRNCREVQEQIVVLFRTLERMLDAKELVVERSFDEKAARNSSKAMQKKVTLNVEEMPLSDFVAELEKQTGVPILLDQAGLESIGHSVDTPVTYRCKEKPLRCIVDCLWDFEMTWVSRFGALEVTTQEQAEQSLCASVFEVSDLVKMPEGHEHDMNDLAAMVTRAADPESWREVGGPGGLFPVCLKGRSFLIVCQTELVMEEVRQFLLGLRVIRDKKLLSFPPLDKADQQVLQKLEKQLNWDVKEGTMLADFLKEFERRLGVVVRVDEVNLECLGFSPKQFSLDPICVNDFSAAGMLDLLLDPYEMDWMVRHGEVFVSSEEEMEQRLFLKLYDVTDLTVFVDAQGEVWYDSEALPELLMSTVGPESWSEGTGPASAFIPSYFFGKKNVMVIWQTYSMHQKIAQFFVELRAVLPKDRPKRTSSVRHRGESVSKDMMSFRGRYGWRASSKEDEKEVPKNLPPLHPKQAALVESNNAFAVKLYGKMVQQFNKEERCGGGFGRAVRRKNFCFSPYSIAALTQMIKAGTGGETDRQLQKALCLTLSGNEMHGAYGSLLTSLLTSKSKPNGFLGSRVGSDLPKRVPRRFDLAIANRLWVQEASDAQILPQFCKVLEKRYLAGIEEMDFVHKGSESARRINKWVSQNTKGQINEIIFSDEFNELTRFIAVNAVFFQGRWAAPFSKTKTKQKLFYDSDGKTELGEVSMMCDSHGMYQLGKVDGVSVFRKPYVGDASFFILLPRLGEGELEKLEASLSSAKLRKWIASPTSQMLEKVEIPKFELESTFPLIDVMKQLGVTELFDENGADFSGMVPSNSVWAQQGLWVYLMLHKATIKVDEVGTVATGAGMCGGMGGGMMEPEPQEFIANRPFLFLVFDEKTSSLLFMGRYMGPEFGFMGGLERQRRKSFRGGGGF